MVVRRKKNDVLDVPVFAALAELPPVNVDSDYGDYVAPTQGGNSLAVLAELAQKQMDAEAAVAGAQAQLTRAQETLRDISERQLPEAMAEVGMATFQTSTGLKIEVSDVYRTSPPKAKREEAWAWLRANGNAGLLKRSVTVEFGKGEDAKAQELALKMIKEFPDSTSDETTVHHTTLSAFVTKQLKDGKDLPLDVFGVHKQCKAKVTPPK